MQMQIVVMLKYCRCSFSGRVIQLGLNVSISSSWLFEGSKIPLQSTCSDLPLHCLSVTTTIWIFNLKKIWEKTKAYFSGLHLTVLTYKRCMSFLYVLMKLNERELVRVLRRATDLDNSAPNSGFETSWSLLPVLCRSSARIDWAWHTLPGKTLSLNVYACWWEGSLIWSKITSSYKAGQWNSVRNLQVCLNESSS